MEFRAKDLKDLIREDIPSDFYLEVVEEGVWEDEGKWSGQEIIFKHEGKFYSLYVGRTGSYYTDYYYDYFDWKDEDMINCIEVEQVEVVTKVWRLKI